MPSSIEYLNFILEQLRDIEKISFKKMMGEYLLYINEVLIGGIYDDRLLIKKTESNKEYNLNEDIPYDGAKNMWIIEEVDKKDLLEKQVLNVYLDLKKEK